MGSNAAQTRWDARPKFSTPNDALMQWSLVKNKSGTVASWDVRWNEETHHISVVSRLHSDRILRRQPMTGPFAVTAHAQNTDRLLCVNQEAQSAGLERGMSLSDAHALCPSLRSEPHHPQADQYF